MGDQTNPKGFNWVAWISTVAVTILTVVVVYSSIREIIGRPVP
jgi:Mn2+/Fe2+ NRAMP family transporter